MVSPDMQRITRIRDYCEEIEKTIKRFGVSFDVFASDSDFQRSISFCILQIGELASGLTQEYRSTTSPCIQWGLIKGMRNWVAHNYANVRLEEIWETAIKDIPDLKRFCTEQIIISEHLQEPQEETEDQEL